MFHSRQTILYRQEIFAVAKKKTQNISILLLDLKFCCSKLYLLPAEVINERTHFGKTVERKRRKNPLQTAKLV